MITYSKSFLDFIKNSDCNIAKILFRLTKKRYEPLMVTNKDIDYITFRMDGTISYLPAGKEHKVNEETGDWLRDGRQNGKPGKVIKKLFAARVQKYFKDADFECFANNYKANFSDNGYKFELLRNTDIPDVYEMDILDGQGSLNNSCMNGNTDYLDIYKYCKKLSILTLTNADGLLCGRSLIWNIEPGITLMDRIYVVQDFMYDKFIDYARQNKYWYKKNYKSYDDKTTFIDADGNEVKRNFTIVTDCDHSEYPYIDTFQYGDDCSLNNYGAGFYTYNNTDGTREGDHYGEIYDEINGEYISEDDCVYITSGERQYRGRNCHVDNCVEVDGDWYYNEDENIVEVNGTWYKKDSGDICEVDGEYHLTDDCTYCERDNCYYLSEDCVYCEEDEEDVLISEAVEIEDKWYHKESDLIFERNGKYYLEAAGVNP